MNEKDLIKHATWVKQVILEAVATGGTESIDLTIKRLFGEFNDDEAHSDRYWDVHNDLWTFLYTGSQLDLKLWNRPPAKYTARQLANFIWKIETYIRRLQNRLDRKSEHVAWVKHGLCPVCGHYGSDCTGSRVAQ